MARPRLPTEIQALKGAFRKNPQRTRPVGAKASRPLGNPPRYFAEDEVEIWLETVEDAPAGVLTSADRTVFELLCRLRAKFRRDWLTGAEMSQMTWCLSHLGFTPSDRSKVEGQPEETSASPADEFLN